MDAPQIRRLAVLFLTVILSLVPLATAAAGRAPLIERYGFSGTDDVIDHCGPLYGDFDILSTHTFRYRDEYRFRADGTWDVLLENEYFNSTLTNSVTGKAVPVDGRLLLKIYFADDGMATSWDTATITSLTISGVDFQTNVPGLGLVVHDAGIFYVERVNDSLAVVGWHGRHDINMVTNQANFADVYCPILAGN